MADKRHSILLAGESWVTTATHIKGFDQFATVTFHLGAEPLVEALKGSAFDLRYMPAHEAQRDFPQTPEALAAYDAVILSDIGVEHAAAASRHLDRQQAHAEPAQVAARLCRERRRAPDGRRLLQLPGHQWRRPLPQHAGRGGAAGRPPALRRPRRGAGGLHAGRHGARRTRSSPASAATGRRCSASTR